MCYYLPSQNMYLCDKTFDIYTADEMEEMDKMEQHWKASTKKNTARELLEIFPEARRVLTTQLKKSIQENKKLIDSLYQKERELTNRMYEHTPPADRWYTETLITHFFTNQRVKLEKLLRQQAFFLSSLSSPQQDTKNNHITDQDIAHAKEIPIETLYGEQLQKQGSRLVGPCQFHQENHGSFTIFSKQNTWYCFGQCADGGDSISFIQKRDNVDFIAAVKKLLSR